MNEPNWICEKGHPASGEMPFCTKCGAAVRRNEQVIRGGSRATDSLPNCAASGHRHVVGGRYCANCGWDATAQFTTERHTATERPATTASAPPSPDDIPAGSRCDDGRAPARRTALVVVACVAVLALGVLNWLARGGPSSNLAGDFASAVGRFAATKDVGDADLSISTDDTRPIREEIERRAQLEEYWRQNGTSNQIIDQVGAIPIDQLRDVQTKLDEVQATTGYLIYVTFVETFDGVSGSEWADATARQLGLGSNDVLLSVATEDRVYGISFDQSSSLAQTEISHIQSAVQAALRDAVNAPDEPVGFAGAVIAMGDAMIDTHSSIGENSARVTNTSGNGELLSEEELERLFHECQDANWTNSQPREESALTRNGGDVCDALYRQYLLLTGDSEIKECDDWYPGPAAHFSEHLGCLFGDPDSCEGWNRADSHYSEYWACLYGEGNWTWESEFCDHGWYSDEGFPLTPGTPESHACLRGWAYKHIWATTG